MKMFHCLIGTDSIYLKTKNESPEYTILGKMKINNNVPLTLVLSILNNGNYMKLELYSFFLEKLPLHIIEKSSGLDAAVIRLVYKKIDENEPKTLELCMPNLNEPIEIPSITMAVVMQFLSLLDKLITGGKDMLKRCTGPMGLEARKEGDSSPDIPFRRKIMD
jgi:hypothetical protein